MKAYDSIQENRKSDITNKLNADGHHQEQKESSDHKIIGGWHRLTNFLIVLVIVIASLFSANKLFTNSFFTSHDGEGHVIRLEEFNNSLKESGVPVRIAKRLNNGLGSYFFNFNYPGVYYLGEAYHFLSLGYVDSFKALLVTSSILGGFGMFLFAKQYFSKLASLLASIFYIFAPYKLLNLYVRGDVAEALGLGVLPFLFYAVAVQIKKPKKISLSIILSLALTILFHNITAMLSVIFVTLFLLVNIISVKDNQDRKDILVGFALSCLIALFLTSFFWFPAVVEAKYTHLFDLIVDYPNYFASIKEIVYSPWGFGLFKLGDYPGKMSPQVGLAHSLIFLVTLIALLTKRKSTNTYNLALFFVVVVLLCTFLSTSYSQILWDKISLLRFVQIPWRFIGYVIFSTSFLAGYMLEILGNLKVKIVLFTFLSLFLVYSIRNDINVNSYIKFSDPFSNNIVFDGSTTSKSEHTPIWTPIGSVDKFDPNGNFISGKGVSERIIWKTNYHEFSVNASESALFVDNTSYFPGWTAKVDNTNTQVDYSMKTLGRLGIFLPKGQHKVEFIFTETNDRLIPDLISIFTLGFVILFTLNEKRFY